MERLWAPWRLEYVQSADEQDGCFFCRAAASDDDEAQLVVHRGERAFVLLNKFPYASGHLLVAPYRHGLNFDDLDDDEALEIHRLGAQGLAALRAVYAPEGFNLGWNIGAHRRRRHPRPRAPARRAAVGRRHELHAGARRRQGDPGASPRDAGEARRRLADALVPRKRDEAPPRGHLDQTMRRLLRCGAPRRRSRLRGRRGCRRRPVRGDARTGRHVRSRPTISRASTRARPSS